MKAKLNEELIYKEIRKRFLRERKEFSGPRKFFRGSELNDCPRRIYFRRLGVPDEEKDVRSFLRLNEGSLHHREIQKILKKIFPEGEVEKTVRRRIKRGKRVIEIRGTPDFMIPKIVYEIKTASESRFQRILKGDIPQKYLYQLNTYLALTKIRQGCFIFKNINTGELKFIPYSFDEELWEIVKDRLFYIEDLLSKNKVPERRISEECSFCSFYERCFEKALPEERDKVLEELATKYLECKSEIEYWEGEREKLKNLIRTSLLEREADKIKLPIASISLVRRSLTSYDKTDIDKLIREGKIRVFNKEIETIMVRKRKEG